MVKRHCVWAPFFSVAFSKCTLGLGIKVLRIRAHGLRFSNMGLGLDFGQTILKLGRGSNADVTNKECGTSILALSVAIVSFIN